MTLGKSPSVLICESSPVTSTFWGYNWALMGKCLARCRHNHGHGFYGNVTLRCNPGREGR